MPAIKFANKQLQKKQALQPASCSPWEFFAAPFYVNKILETIDPDKTISSLKCSSGPQADLIDPAARHYVPEAGTGPGPEELHPLS